MKKNYKQMIKIAGVCLFLMAAMCIFSWKPNKIEAAPMVGYATLRSGRFTTVNGRNFARMTLGGVTALCIDPQLKSYNGTMYRMVSTTSNAKYVQALNFVRRYSSAALADYYYAMAQCYAWGLSRSAAKEYVVGYLKRIGKYSEAEIEKGFSGDWNRIAGMSSNGIVVIWEAACEGGRQRMITLGAQSEMSSYECEGRSRSCEYDSSTNTYYGINGQEVSFDQYMIECAEELACYYNSNTGKYYGLNGQEVTEEEYYQQCDEDGGGDNPPEETICPVPEGTPAGTCEVQGVYSDPSFDEIKQCTTNKEEYYLEGSQPTDEQKYCKAYCIEEVYTLFPGADYTFQAGQYFTVGSSPISNVWGPISFTGTRTCKSFKDNGFTEGVNTDTFIKEYNGYVLTEITAYNDWQNAVRKQQAAQSATAHPQDKRCSSTTGKVCDYGDVSGNQCVISNYTPGYCSNYNAPDGCGWVNEVWSTTVVGTAHCPSGYYEDGGTCRQNPEYWGTYYDSNSYQIYNNNGYQGLGYTNAGCSMDSADTQTPYNRYITAQKNRQKMEQILNNCNEFQFEYNLEPLVTFTYTADSNYSFTDEVLSSSKYAYTDPVSNGSAQANVNGSGSNSAPAYCQGADCNLVHYECSGDYCTYSGNRTSLNVAGINVSSKTSVSHAYAEYSLDSTTYRYVSKVNGAVTTSIPSNLSANGAYIDLGANVIPISVSLIPGRYDISISYSRIGHINGSQGHFDPYIEETADYMCYIDIKNDIEGKECEQEDKPAYCDEGGSDNCSGDDCLQANGIDVIYRTIKLGSQDVAFPGENGEGRTPGANWDEEGLVDSYITNNRGVSGDEVYQLEPLYKITLTPQIIKEIRRYNQLVDDYGDFNLNCDAGKGTRCMSNFIHGMVSGEGTSFNFSTYFSGTCASASRVDFMSCADKG